MDFKKILGSTKIAYVLAGIGTLIVALLIFHAGVSVGYHKATFSYRLGDNYHRAFGGSRKQQFMGTHKEDFRGGHGTIGKIIKIELPTLVIEDKDNVEKIITISDNTLVRRFREELNPEDLKVNDSIVVIGSPSDTSEIQAGLIRILPQ